MYNKKNVIERTKGLIMYMEVPEKLRKFEDVENAKDVQEMIAVNVFAA